MVVSRVLCQHSDRGQHILALVCIWFMSAVISAYIRKNCVYGYICGSAFIRALQTYALTHVGAVFLFDGCGCGHLHRMPNALSEQVRELVVIVICGLFVYK